MSPQFFSFRFPPKETCDSSVKTTCFFRQTSAVNSSRTKAQPYRRLHLQMEILCHNVKR